MNTQQEDPKEQNQGDGGEENGNSQKTRTENSSAGNLVPDDEIRGSDADIDRGPDTSVSPDQDDDEN